MTAPKSSKAKATLPKAAPKSSKAKATPPKAAPKSSKTKATTPKAAPKSNRHEKREKALALRRTGKTYKEIQVACGFANAGAACNAVKRALAAETAA